MKKETKQGLAVIGTMAAVAGGVIAATRVKAAPLPEGAVIDIEVLDAEGNPLPHNSPVTLTEGESYTVKLTITNLSAKGEVSWEATLTVGTYAGTNVRTLIPAQSSDEIFDASETRIFTYPMDAPLGSGGESGDIYASVKDPAGALLADATEPFTIAEVPIDYGATIVIG